MSNQQEMVNQYRVQHSHGTHPHPHTHPHPPRVRRGSHLARLETSTLSSPEQVDANSPTTTMPRSPDDVGAGGATGVAGGQRGGVSGRMMSEGNGRYAPQLSDSLMSEASSEGNGRHTPLLSESMISDLSLGSTGQRTPLSGSLISEASSEGNGRQTPQMSDSMISSASSEGTGRHTPQMSDSMISSTSSEWSTQYTPPATTTNSLILDKASTDTSKATPISTSSAQQAPKRSSRNGEKKVAHKPTSPKNSDKITTTNSEAPPNTPRTLSSTISNLWQWILSQTTTQPQLVSEHDVLLQNLARLETEDQDLANLLRKLARLETEEQNLATIEDGLERAIVQRRINEDRAKAEKKLEKLASEAFEREERDAAAEDMRRVVVREERGDEVAEKVVGAGMVVVCLGLAWRERGRWVRGEGLVVRGMAWSWRVAGETPWMEMLWRFVVLSQRGRD
ncbi:hypothetical protein HYFRA_00010308 [Hymenoscyphus fraxineus]|uniref:Uncharacterized protein n=1 Tax=Hymenoscyphus fraxineus TaxID=746836 RepID=A0A9N9L0N3_9HELO|nr:hypothetical protein HYFRA_00010308 [Hymenoscyphus fraxineus]